MAEVFANPLAELAEYTDMKQDMDKGKGPIQVSGVTDSQKVHVMHELSKEHPWRLVVTYDDNRAKEIYDDFSYFEPNTWLYPARDLLFYSSDIHGNLLLSVFPRIQGKREMAFFFPIFHPGSQLLK